MGPAYHRGGERAVESREQDDERLDKVRDGRGPDTGGELLGWQRAGGGGVAHSRGLVPARLPVPLISGQ